MFHTETSQNKISVMFLTLQLKGHFHKPTNHAIDSVYLPINSVYQVINSIYQVINSVYQPINSVYKKILCNQAIYVYGKPNG